MSELKFYNEKGDILPDLLDKKALEIARTFIEKDEKKSKYNRDEYNGISNTQLRRLFDEVKRFERKLKANPENWNKTFPLIKMIKSKSAYSTARAIKERKFNKKYYENLNNFIKNGINQIQNYKDYKTFCLLFEAVYGFYYELGGAVNK